MFEHCSLALPVRQRPCGVDNEDDPDKQRDPDGGGKYSTVETGCKVAVCEVKSVIK